MLLPFGEGFRYDLAIEAEGCFFRVQVKTGCLSADRSRVVFNTCSNNKGYGRKEYSEGIDLFAVYCDQLQKAYLVPLEKTGRSSTTLRVSPPKNGQIKGVLLAKDLEINSREDLARLLNFQSGV